MYQLCRKPENIHIFGNSIISNAQDTKIVRYLCSSVHVLVEGRFVHKIDEFSFLDSPEWESFCEEFPEHFQVSLKSSCRNEIHLDIDWMRAIELAAVFGSSSRLFRHWSESADHFKKKIFFQMSLEEM